MAARSDERQDRIRLHSAAQVIQQQPARLFMQDSDGNMKSIIPELLEAGLNFMHPMEPNAGMDVVKLREQYGTRLAFYGNIDIKKMLASETELRAELERKIPQARDGGYIRHSDHSVPPQVDYARYQWMLKTAREIFAG